MSMSLSVCALKSAFDRPQARMLLHVSATFAMTLVDAERHVAGMGSPVRLPVQVDQCADFLLVVNGVWNAFFRVKS